MTEEMVVLIDLETEERLIYGELFKIEEFAIKLTNAGFNCEIKPYVPNK